MKKILSLMLVGILAFSLFGCDTSEVNQDQNDNNDEVASGETETQAEAPKEITLEDVNKFLNESGDLGPGTSANPVTVIPYKHINGQGDNSDYYAFVKYEYRERDFVKYQVSFISCT